MDNKYRLVSILESVACDESKENTFTISSKSTGSLYNETGDLKEVSLHDGKIIIENIVNGIFDANVGVANISSSQPSLNDSFEDSEEMDERLKRWQDTLRDRVKLQKKIFRKTGKSPNEMLCNLPVSLEQRDKGSIQRMMDFASRMNPITLSQKQPDVLPERKNKHTGRCLPELQETLPEAERTGKKETDISGLPMTTKKEILAPLRVFKGPPSRQKTKWQNSKVLEKHIMENTDDIKRVLEFCPNINRLEVVVNNSAKIVHHDDINLMNMEDIVTLSSSTEITMIESQVTCLGNSPQMQPEDLYVGIKINDKIYSFDQKRNPAIGDLNLYFQCEPFQCDVQEVLRLENIGKKVIICNWGRNYDTLKPPQAWNECGKSFLFDHKLIMLFPGDVCKPKALYRPCMVTRCKERWELKIFPNVFCGGRGTLVVQLNGKCVPSPIYTNKLNYHLQHLVEKSNDQIIKKLSTRQARLAPIIETPPVLCPYKRNLDERELFNAVNVGYHCERFEDIENLRALYVQNKNPRDPVWDLSVDAIKKIIIDLPLTKSREQNFKKLIKILDSMKFSGNMDFSSFDHYQEQERSRLVYVRGCIANGLEEWEDLMNSIEQTCLRSELVTYLSQSTPAGSNEDSTTDNKKLEMRLSKSEELQKELLKKLRAKKYYRDSLYIQTYTHLCDIAENIVSIIESTELV